MGNLNTFSAKIKTVLESIELSGSTAFVDVIERATNNFSGFPSATIVPGDAPSEYATVVQNQRAYTIFIYIYINMETTDDDQAWSNGRELIDSVLDALDKSNDLDDTADFVRPAPMAPFETDVTGTGKCLIAPVKIVCAKTVDLFS